MTADLERRARDIAFYFFVKQPTNGQQDWIESGLVVQGSDIDQDVIDLAELLVQETQSAVSEERERCAKVCDERRAPCAAHAIRDGAPTDLRPTRQDLVDALGAALMYQDDTDRFAEAREVYESAIRKGPSDGE